MTTDTTQALVPIPDTGEAVDLINDPDERLAWAVDQLDGLLADASDAKNEILNALVPRLDKIGKWTHRVRVGGREFEIKAPSPDAGTTSYNPATLEDRLRAHVAADELAPAACDAALERTVTVTFKVPITADSLEAVADAVRKATEVTIGGVQVEIGDVTAQRKVKVAGMNALAKIPAAKETVELCTVTLPAPARKASVKEKHKER